MDTEPTSEAVEAPDAPAPESNGVPASREDKRAAALDAMDGVPAETEEVAEETAPPSEAAPADDPTAGKSKTELWATINEQNRKLREMAGAQKSPNDMTDAELYDIILSRPAAEEEPEAPEAEGDAPPDDPRWERLEALEKREADRQRQAGYNEAYRTIDTRITGGKENGDGSWPFLEAMRGDGSYNEAIDTFVRLTEIEGSYPDLDRVLNSVEESLRERETTRRGRYDHLFGSTPPKKPARRTTRATEPEESRTIASGGAGDTTVPEDKPTTREGKRKAALARMQELEDD